MAGRSLSLRQVHPLIALTAVPYCLRCSCKGQRDSRLSATVCVPGTVLWAQNEFGEVGIDDALVMETKEEIFEMNNGCVCCTGALPAAALPISLAMAALCWQLTRSKHAGV